jgi:chaperonin GroES
MASAFKRLIPTLNRVLVRKLEAETVTKSGIILSQPDDKTPIGVIVATGPGRKEEEKKRISMNFLNKINFTK